MKLSRLLSAALPVALASVLALPAGALAALGGPDLPPGAAHPDRPPAAAKPAPKPAPTATTPAPKPAPKPAPSASPPTATHAAPTPTVSAPTPTPAPTPTVSAPAPTTSAPTATGTAPTTTTAPGPTPAQIRAQRRRRAAILAARARARRARILAAERHEAAVTAAAVWANVKEVAPAARGRLANAVSLTIPPPLQPAAVAPASPRRDSDAGGGSDVLRRVLVVAAILMALAGIATAVLGLRRRNRPPRAAATGLVEVLAERRGEILIGLLACAAAVLIGYVIIHPAVIYG